MGLVNFCHGSSQARFRASIDCKIYAIKIAHLCTKLSILDDTDSQSVLQVTGPYTHPVRVTSLLSSSLCCNTNVNT